MPTRIDTSGSTSLAANPKSKIVDIIHKILMLTKLAIDYLCYLWDFHFSNSVATIAEHYSLATLPFVSRSSSSQIRPLFLLIVKRAWFMAAVISNSSYTHTVSAWRIIFIYLKLTTCTIYYIQSHNAISIFKNVWTIKVELIWEPALNWL